MQFHRFRRSRLVLVGALCAAAFAAGCGGSDDEDAKKEYREGLTEAQREFSGAIGRAGVMMRTAAQQKSPEQYQEGASELQAALDEFEKELEQLDTPSDAENEQEAVTESMDEFKLAVGRIKAAVDAKDQKAIQSNALEVREKGAAVDQAIETLKEAVE